MRNVMFGVSRFIRTIFSHKKQALFAVIAVVLVAGLVPSSYFYGKYQQVQTMLKRQNDNSTNGLIAKIKDHVTLPDETPQIITVDERQLNLGLPFFRNAKKGDILLMYQKAGKAVLYRLSIDRVMEMAETQTPAPTEKAASASGAAGANVRIAVFNGTKFAGRAKTYSTKIQKAFPKAEVVSTGNSKNDYTKTEIIDLTGKNSDFAASLAKELDGELAALQPGEAKPSDDILIIAGK